MTRYAIAAAPIAVLAALALPGTALAACPTGLPPGVYCGSLDPAAAVAGTYKMDETHAAVLAKVSHIGYSKSVFRFDTAQATLVWDPADLSKASLKATIDTASITSNVPGFAKEISGQFLKADKFPQASFVSTAFRRIDPTHGEIDGQFTLAGVTKPLTLKIALVGAGKGFGHPRLGAEAVGVMDPQAYGLPSVFLDPIELVIDAEFERQD